MNRTLTLKLFLSISLGLHFFAFSILSILLPELKIMRLPRLNMEVSLLPFIKEESEIKKSVRNNFPWSDLIDKPLSIGGHSQKEEESHKTVEKQEAEIKSEPLPVIHEEKKVSPIEKMEVAPSTKEQASIVRLPIQSEVKMVSISEAKPSLLESEKKEGEGKQGEKVVVASLGISLPQAGSSETPSVAMKSPSLTEKEVLFVQPRYAENPRPLYPREAKKKGYEGEVLLRVEVLADGRVGEIEVKRSSGHEVLDRSAVTAVKQWKFFPARRGETPISTWVNIPIAFQLR